MSTIKVQVKNKTKTLTKSDLRSLSIGQCVIDWENDVYIKIADEESDNNVFCGISGYTVGQQFSIDALMSFDEIKLCKKCTLIVEL